MLKTWRGAVTRVSLPVSAPFGHVQYAQFSTSLPLHKGKRWTTAELGLVKELTRQYQTPWEISSHLPDRSQNSVSKQVAKTRLELGTVRVLKTWSDEDLATLQECRMEGMTYASIYALLPDISQASMRAKAIDMHKPAEDMSRMHLPMNATKVANIGHLRDSEHIGYQEIARRLKRRVDQIRVAYQKNRVWAPTSVEARPWSKRDKEEVIRLVQAGKSAREIAEAMGRTVTSAKNMIKAMRQEGTLNFYRNRPRPKEELEEIRQLKCDGVASADDARETARSHGSVK